MKSSSLPLWDVIQDAVSAWAAPRLPRDGDVRIILYRDANSWCPFCHRVWYFLEEKGLRYATQTVHLQGDPAEPPKQTWYKQLIASGAVPAVRIRDEMVPESLDILYRLEEEFPEPRMLPLHEREYAHYLCKASEDFNTDSSDWLHNTRKRKEKTLREQVLEQFDWLESVLASRGGPFFLGPKPSIVDAAFVGFLTRQVHNVLFFKGINLRDSSQRPRLAAWFEAMESRPAFNKTKQDAYFEQRIYQAHPQRRPCAEGCMQLGPKGSLVGEPDCGNQPKAPVETLVPACPDAMEAAWRLAERRDAVVHFLLRKHANRVLDSEKQGALETCDLHLRALAALLSGTSTLDSVLREIGGADCFSKGFVCNLGELIGTPRDMSSAAAAQLRGALDLLVIGKSPELQAHSAKDEHLNPQTLCLDSWLKQVANANPFETFLQDSNLWIDQATRFVRFFAEEFDAPNLLCTSKENNDAILVIFDDKNERCCTITRALILAFPHECACLAASDAIGVEKVLQRHSLLSRQHICLNAGISAVLPSGLVIGSCERHPKALLYELRYQRSVIAPKPSYVSYYEQEYLVGLQECRRKGGETWWSEAESILLIKKALEKDSMCTLDNFLPDPVFKRLLQATQELHGKGEFDTGLVQQRRNGSLYFKVSSLQLERNDASLFEQKSHGRQWSMFKDEMIYLGDHEIWDSLTEATDLLVSCLLDSFKDSSLSQICFREEMQIARFDSKAGGRYHHHSDTDGGNWRRLTAILYLNEDWENEHGGELRMFMPGCNVQVRCDTLPIANRLVLFWADQRCPHEVLHATRDRWAATVWYADGPTILNELAGGIQRLNKLTCDSRLPRSAVALAQKFIPVAPACFEVGLRSAGLDEVPARRISEVSHVLRSARRRGDADGVRSLVRYVDRNGKVPEPVKKCLKRKRRSSHSLSDSSTSQSSDN